MVSDFESRLATVLGARLPAPFGGNVAVAGDDDSAHGSQPRIFVGVYKTRSLPKDFGTNRTVRVPGVSDLINVLPLKVFVNINVIPAQNADRVQQLQGIEQINYLLDSEPFQTGTALADAGDHGFQIHSMRVEESVVAVGDAPEIDRPAGISVVAEGIFWPIGIAGETGIDIDEIRLRGLTLDIRLEPATPHLNAGGAATTLFLMIDATASHRLGGDETPLAFDRITVELQQPGGQPGAGSLAGGTAGSGNTRHLTITDGVATAVYTPPGTAAKDLLRVGFDDGDDGLGRIAAQFEIEVR
ncbi:MAG: hypothetical protein GY850_15790 [bacterium]|nr:hypothetical protein [bacterium]